MNKKKVLIISIGVIFIIICIVILVIILNHNKEANNSNEIATNVIEEEIIEEIVEERVHIRSSEKKPIEKDGIEAVDIELYAYGNQLEVLSTLKNKTEKDINNLSIGIEFLDKKGKTVTMINNTSDEVFKAGETIKIKGLVVGIKDQDKIKSARIVRVEKN